MQTYQATPYKELTNFSSMTSCRSRVTSALVTPAYVILGVLFVWLLQLQTAVNKQQIQHGHLSTASKVAIEHSHRARRSAGGDSTANSFLNMLPDARQANVVYDMELEPCGGAVFTVWGRSECPEETNTELIYEGVVGGTNTETAGGGVDYLCLSRHPQWVTSGSGSAANADKGVNGRPATLNDDTRTKDSKEPEKPCTTEATSNANSRVTTTQTPPSEDEAKLISHNELLHLLLGQSDVVETTPTTTTENPGNKDAYLYGTEFKGADNRLQRHNLAADTFVDQDAVCAVCRSKLRLSAVMIPGRRECYSGWTKEYEGFLMTGPVGAQSQHRFVCVHNAPEASQGGFRRETGAVFYHVKAMCGSLPCPTYIQDREITCVVCTK